MVPSYVFKMVKEPRWVCTEDSKHFQKMKETDLKLEKMASLIPSKDRKKVDMYFLQKRMKIEEKKRKAVEEN